MLIQEERRSQTSSSWEVKRNLDRRSCEGIVISSTISWSEKHAVTELFQSSISSSHLTAERRQRMETKAPCHCHCHISLSHFTMKLVLISRALLISNKYNVAYKVSWETWQSLQILFECIKCPTRQCVCDVCIWCVHPMCVSLRCLSNPSKKTVSLPSLVSLFFFPPFLLLQRLKRDRQSSLPLVYFWLLFILLHLTI